MSFNPFDIGNAAANLTRQFMEDADIGVPRSIGAPIFDVGAPPPRSGDVPARATGTRSAGGYSTSGGVVRRQTRAEAQAAQAAAQTSGYGPGTGFGAGLAIPSDEYLQTMYAKIQQVNDLLDQQKQEVAAKNLQSNIEKLLQQRVVQLMSGRSGQSMLGDLPNVTQVSQGRALMSAAQWKTPLPFAGTIPANSVASLEIQPQRFWYGWKLVIPASQAAGLYLTDVRVANTTQLIAAGEISAENLGPNLFVDENVVTSVCPPAQTVQLTFRNDTGLPIYVTATYFGTASMVQPEIVA